MIPLVQNNINAINALCRQYGVARLDVFGSAADHDTDVSVNDLDFLVTFGTTREMGPADQYFGLLFDLEKLLGRQVDLVCANAMQNPYFIREVDRSRRLLYAA